MSIATTQRQPWAGATAPPEPGLRDLDDHDLVAAVAARRHGALAELYRRHAPGLHALGLRMLRHPHDAEEVLQETFLYAWRRAATYDRAKASPSTWLVLIARSRCLDRLRGQRRRRNATESAERQVRRTHAIHEGFERTLGEARTERLRSALDRLPAAQRRVLELCYYAGLTQRETAAEMGIPLGTVKTRTLLAMKKLRRDLAPEATALI